MSKEGCLPDLFIYNTVICGLVKDDGITKAFWLFYQMRKMMYSECITLYTLLPGVVNSGSIGYAFKVVEQFMYQKQVSLGRSFWDDLMSGTLKEAELNLAISFAHKLVPTGLCKNGSIMEPIIKVLSKQKISLEVQKLFQKFTKSFGVRPPVGIYYHLNEGFPDIHLKDLALDTYRDMKSVGCAPDVPTYNLLLYDLGKSAKVNELFELYNEMPDRGCKPNTITQNILISGLMKLGILDEAKILFKEMIEYECKPNCDIYNILINEFEKAGEVDITRDLFHRMVEEGITPDLKSYMLVDCFCLFGRVDNAMYYFEEIKADELDPYLIYYNIIINDLVEAGKFKATLNILEEMGNRGDTKDHHPLNRWFSTFDPWRQGSSSCGGIVMTRFGVNCGSDVVKKNGLTLVDAIIDIVKSVEDRSKYICRKFSSFDP